MTNNQDAARQGFTEALASGQAVPVTMNPFAGRDPINLLTSSNTNLVNGQPVLPAGAPNPQREINEEEVREWIFHHVRGGDTRGDTVLLNVDTYLNSGDLLFKRIDSLFGKRVLLVQDNESRYEEKFPELQELNSPEGISPKAVEENQEYVVEMMAQDRLNHELLEHRTNQRYEELRAQAVKDKKLPKEKEGS